MTQTTSTQSWHIAKWGTLGWLETGVKAVGIVAGLIAFTQTVATGSIQIAGLGHGVSLVILGLLTLLVVGVIALRISQREIVSIVYAIFNALGHLGMLYHVVYTPDSTLLPVIFSSSYILGELVKQRFLITTGYTEMGQQTSQMLQFSRGLVVIYAILAFAILL